MRVPLRLAALALLAAMPALARPADDGVARAPVATEAPPPKPLAEVLRELDAILLAGEALPADFLPGLAPLPPADRLLAVAYARRAGLLTGPALPLADLLRVQP